MTAGLAEFHRLWGDLDALRWLVVERIEQDVQRVARRSRETTTHYKWLLAWDRPQGMKIWLHEFKPASERRPGYAATVHNHRYPFTAIALSGGYTNVQYDIVFDAESLRVDRCDVVGSQDLTSGQTYSMEPDGYHYVDEIEDGTKTLIMEFPAVASASYSFDQRGDRMTEHLALDARLRNLLRPQALLAGAAKG
jgi:hypothetical protein